MSFSTLSSRLQPIAEAALRHFTAEYGRSGLVVGGSISSAIPWRPTFHLRATKHHIIAVEVDEVIYPQILKIAARDLVDAPTPVSAYAVCPLESYLADQNQQQVRDLQAHGFGLYAANGDGTLLRKGQCVPLLQHIPEKELSEMIHDLTPRLKVSFKHAYSVYSTDAGQGLQEAGQIVEAMLHALARHAVGKTWVSRGVLTKPASGMIDELYASPSLSNHRAALGGAREFMKTHRNPVSHPPKTLKESIQKLRHCKEGFLAAVRVSVNLRDAMTQLGCKVVVHV